MHEMKDLGDNNNYRVEELFHQPGSTRRVACVCEKSIRGLRKNGVTSEGKNRETDFIYTRYTQYITV